MDVGRVLGGNLAVDWKKFLRAWLETKRTVSVVSRYDGIQNNEGMAATWLVKILLPNWNRF